MRREKSRWMQAAGWILFFVYLALLVYLLFFSETYGRRVSPDRVYRYNLQPFQEIRRFILYWRQLGFGAALTNLGGNIVGFLPFGFFLPALCVRLQRLVPVLALGFSLSLAVELIQLVTRVGIFDVDDLILNTLGVLLGYWAFVIWRRMRKGRDHGKKV